MPPRARRPCCCATHDPAVVLRHRALDRPTPLLLRRRHPTGHGQPTPAAPPFHLSGLRRCRPCCSLTAKYSPGEDMSHQPFILALPSETESASPYPTKSTEEKRFRFMLIDSEVYLVPFGEIPLHFDNSCDSKELIIQ
ncbi:hypothetical protein BRADI_2g26645v3 [Brachypodium distachyon]|uniref:Uncharacterized protein n=1 Tax=Brachypodium distachyon TaxID=15368 RepID=A0A0Q3IL07_BRADI|nr:hypothetical protein BRADI_2g26645v3 [Brachypodium distachyon]